MTQPKEQQQQVQDFFDRHAAKYRNKYSGANAFHHYFFTQRLQAATEGLDFNGKRILDIGAGTGNLYDYIDACTAEVDYTAVDISPRMMQQSNIPLDRQLVGKCYELEYEQEQFDLIYLLGVTTYFDREENLRVMRFIQDKLAAGGRAIVTFTNRNSIDVRLRKLVSKPLSWLSKGEAVMAQPFEIFSFSIDQVKEMSASLLEIEEIRFLNQTVFPFSKILPGPSVSMADLIHRKLDQGPMLSALSSDFLVFFTAKPPIS